MKTAKSDLDSLIDWYDKYKPENSPLVIKVKAAQSTIEKFAGLKDGKWFYRGREIVPLVKRQK